MYENELFCLPEPHAYMYETDKLTSGRFKPRIPFYCVELNDFIVAFSLCRIIIEMAMAVLMFFVRITSNACWVVFVVFLKYRTLRLNRGFSCFKC